MQVILMEKVLNLGQLGDVVRVKNGYARNFLIPQGEARRATEAAVAEFAARRAELPLAYSHGFHPQAKINFASALPLGFSSRERIPGLSEAEVAEPHLRQDFLNLIERLPAEVLRFQHLRL